MDSESRDDSLSASALNESLWNLIDALRGLFALEEQNRVILTLVLLRRAQCTSPDARRNDAREHVSGELGSAYLRLLGQVPEPVGECLRGLGAEQTIRRIADASGDDRVFQVLSRIDLGPQIEPRRLGSVVRRLMERAYSKGVPDTSTPPGVARLVARLVLREVVDSDSSGRTVRIFDPTCGVGSFFSAASHLGLSVQAVGQEINADTAAECAALCLLSDIPLQLSRGDCLTDDQFTSETFEYVVAHPPMGANWKMKAAAVQAEHRRGEGGRFGPGLPRRADASLLFLLHVLSKLPSEREGGGRAAILTSGSSLWSGGADSGESDIRRHLFQHGLVESIVALPPGALSGTHIPSYVWVLSTGGSQRHSDVILVDAEPFFQDQRKGQRTIHDADIDALVELVSARRSGPDSIVVPTSEFQFREVTVRGVERSPEDARAFVRAERGKARIETTEIGVGLAEILGPLADAATLEVDRIGYRVDSVRHLGFRLQHLLSDLRSEYSDEMSFRSLREVCRSIERVQNDRADPSSTEDATRIDGLRGIELRLDASMVLPEYLELFFRTPLGEKTVASISAGSLSGWLAPSKVQDLRVPVPSLHDQHAVVDTARKAGAVAELLVELENALAANPKNIATVDAVLSPVLGAIGRLSEADEVQSLVRRGESGSIEFKETFSWCLRQGGKQNYVEDSALKTIVAFLNSRGGDLLVGVRDDGTITGVEIDIEKLHKSSEDRFLLHVKNLVRDRIGPEHYPLLTTRLVDVGGRRVVWISCEVSSKPVFYKDEKFFVRTNPATDELTGRRMYEYIEEHFGRRE